MLRLSTWMEVIVLLVVVSPLERGYGITLGNSLRRIMLSSLPGAAVSQVKIDGVLHEFSSIPGVKEDVTEIIMNIKNLAIRNNSSTNEPKVAYIEFEGEGVVKAGDIQVDSDIEILNPELEIAHLNGGVDSKLYMELTITKGRGYISADKNKTEDTPIGVIAVDSIYTPVDRVNLTVENTRVGQVTDYDKLTLDVFTNGTLEPDEAVSLAAKVLSEHLNLFIDLSEAAQQVDIMVEKEQLPGNVRLEMVNIEAGTFVMGSPESEASHSPDEQQHGVNLSADYYMNVSGFYHNDLGRKLFSEIAMIEEQHVSGYESLKDPNLSWLEQWVMHEYTECYLYYSAYEDESDPYIKNIWLNHSEEELTHLKIAAEMLYKYEGREWEQLFISGSEFPSLIKLKSNKDYIREVIKSVRLTT